MTAGAHHPFAPDYTIAPGETLRAHIRELNISQAELALRTGFSTKHVSQIIKGVAPITPETAVILERVTGTSASFWNRREADYRGAVASAKEITFSEADEEWLSTLPIKELQQRGCIPPGSDGQRLYSAALRFFGVADRAAYERLWSESTPAFRRSQAFASKPGAVAAWLRVSQLRAQRVDLPPYSEALFRTQLERIRSLTADGDPNDIVPMCAEAGVAVVFAKEFKGCRISGAAWWARPTRPVLSLSDRYKKDDFFWFTFFHEAAHLLLHSKKETFVDDGGKDSTRLEGEANGWASDFLIPPDAVPELRRLSTDGEIERFAKTIGIAPGIVVGRMHHDGSLPYNRGNSLRRSIEIVNN